MLSLLLTAPFCIYSFWHGVILHPTSFLMIFILVSLIFVSRLSLDCSDDITRTTYVYVRACVLCARSKTEVVTFTCNHDKMASV